MSQELSKNQAKIREKLGTFGVSAAKIIVIKNYCFTKYRRRS